MSPTENAESGLDIVVVSGSPTEIELAAVTVVIRGVLAELALQNEIRENASTNAWQTSQRPLRGSLPPSGWRAFSG
jgi:Acyl-CoA carboxylase epsilon subunit